jgi:hypothetical protein
MLNKAQVEKLRKQKRYIAPATAGDPDLGPLTLLPGTWKNLPGLPGRGWNAIALPFATEPFHYRLLVNQYNEELKFSLVDKAVPNRGIRLNGAAVETDQFVVTLDYEQMITQIKTADNPPSGLAGDPGQAIHHEPGLWLHMTNENTNGIDIARLATIPHGDAALALGKSQQIDGPPVIPDLNGLPIGVSQNLDNPYLAPYKHFHENLFEGLFDPSVPNELLKAANQGVNIVKTTMLTVDTAIETGGISNIPFIVKQANAASMKSTFWIQELAEKDAKGNPKLRLQYSQVVLLDFFPRRDGLPGVIGWPHASINTMEKVVLEADETKAKTP